MPITFLDYHIKNLFSVKDFKYSFQGNGVVLVTGYSKDDKNENGAGKSSISSKAISWILFGKTPLGTKFDKVINKRNSKSPATGEIQFTDGTDQYLIFRSRNPNELKLSRLSNGEWKDISAMDSSETQAIINRILQFDFDVYIQTMFFGQGRLSGYPELTPSSRKEVLKKLLPFSTLENYQESVSKCIKETDKDLFLLENIKLKLQGEMTGTKSAYQNAVEEEKKYLNSINLEKSSLPAWIVNLETLDKTLISLTERLSSDEKKYNELNKDLIELRYNLHVNKELKKNKKCPTCLQLVPTVSPEELEEKIRIIEAQISEDEKAIRLFADFINVDRKNMKQILEYQKYLEKKKSGNIYSKLLNDLVEKINSLHTQEEYLMQDISTAMKKKEILTFWHKFFNKDLPNYLFAIACPFLTEKTNLHLNHLGLPQLHVEYTTIKTLASGEVKDDFHLNVWSDNGGDTFDSLSGGEQQMISFACTMALSDLSVFFGKNSSNILILDEPFTMLSPLNSESMLNYLTSNLSKLKDTIFLISNDEYLKNLIPSQLEVFKENGISSVKDK